MSEAHDADATRLGDVLRRVAREGSGRSEERVRELLRRELEAAGLSMEPPIVDEWVRMVVDPYWPLKHPLRFLRDYIGAHRDDQAADYQSQGPQPLDLEPLATRLLEIHGVVHVRWNSRDSDRFIDVTLDPFSEEMAEQVRQVCAPLIARFSPRDI
jgi:hypothetical protein